MKYLRWLLLLLCTGCTATSSRQQSIDRITKVIVRNVKQQLHLQPSGSGSLGPNKIKGLDLSFVSDQCGDVSSARRLALEVVDIMIQAGRSDQGFEEELETPPFSERHIYMDIEFKPCTTNSDWIEVVMFSPRAISYCRTHPTKSRYEAIFEETHEEAWQKVAEEMMRNNRRLA